MSMKESYEKKLEAKLDELSAEIDKLKAKAKQTEADTELEYYKHIEELKTMQENARTKLNELKVASNDAWKTLKPVLIMQRIHSMML